MTKRDTAQIWEGHKPGTSSVLLDLATTAASGRVRFSWSERALFTACEFWAAARNQSLGIHLSDDPREQLQAAEGSFEAMGLSKTATIIRRGRVKLVGSYPVPSRQVAKEIEIALASIDEPVDEVLENFANTRAQEKDQN
jgi:hypothetical protein